MMLLQDLFKEENKNLSSVFGITLDKDSQNAQYANLPENIKELANALNSVMINYVNYSRELIDKQANTLYNKEKNDIKLSDNELSIINTYPKEYNEFKIKKDKEIVLAAIKEDTLTISLADKSLLRDKEFIITAFKISPFVLTFVDKSLKKEIEEQLKQ